MSRLVGDDPSTLMPKLKEHLALGADLESKGITFEGGPLMTPDGRNSETGAPHPHRQPLVPRKRRPAESA
ncbi:hypothetical protein BIV23_38510 [Streptomyces monashensis]|uniref:Uncharacterized protein n=1 Tax=Streptomyces monashensis TaxID=1678012 RepID=A0A1S2PGB2_9ACTN|nr:hypothetical protein BIV23_38510 [Streptomyces monashensis]